MTDPKTATEKIKEYDNLDCPNCGKSCKPVGVSKNGTVKYKNHWCETPGFGNNYQFSIDKDGNLIE